MRRRLWIAVPFFLLLVVATVSFRAPGNTLVFRNMEMPGTQPEIAIPEEVAECTACHGGYDTETEIGHNGGGSMMAHSGRDPLFWGQMAIAEQDVPGAGNFCIRCHVPVGWLRARARVTDGSQLAPTDANGIKCIVCHRLTNPDNSEFVGMQTEPYVANDGGDPAVGFYGAGQMSLWAGFQKMGPYDPDIQNCPHEIDQSKFHRSSEICGTCHDVSNPFVGDLAPNHGAQFPLDPGTYNGTLVFPTANNQSVLETMAAFNNFPYKYGIVERTYSEHVASAFPTLRIADYPSLPAELRHGAIEQAYKAALGTGNGGDHEDGTPRYFTCQSCHMRPVRAEGCVIPPTSEHKDLPLHDLTGGNTWVPEAIKWLDARGRLRLGGGLTAGQIASLDDGVQRARHNLRQSALLEVDHGAATVRVVNLTGHKLISGYPEGRRMFLNVKWYDASAALVREDGAYGKLDVLVDGVPTQVESLLDLSDPRGKVYEAKMAITQDWAAKMLTLGLAPPNMTLRWDRITGEPALTLVQLATAPPGTARETFHFVLNNAVLSDNRIPPYGMRYDDARERNTLPVPETQYGDPGPGGTYDYWDLVQLDPPPTAVWANVGLYFQTTSWEYIQFLRNQNDRSNPFLKDVGQDVQDAWLATGMAAPELMASAEWVRP